MSWRPNHWMLRRWIGFFATLLDRLYAVVERLVPRHVLADEEGRKHLLERLAVGFDHRLAVLRREIGNQRLLGLHDLGVRFLRRLAEDRFEGLLLIVAELVPDMAADDREQHLGDVPGEIDVALHLVELLR